MRLAILNELPPPPPGKSGWPWDVESPRLPARSDGADWPRIAIVTPSYNQGGFIEETIRSVLLQGYPNLEYRVRDGGSRDNTVEILRKYEPWLTSWSSAKDNGQSDAINTGLRESQFRIGTWINSDDVLLPGALHAVAAHVLSDVQCQFITGDGLFVDETATRTLFCKQGAAYSVEELLHYGGGKYLPQPSVFFSKWLMEQAGALDNRLHYAMDLDLWLRFRERAPLAYIPVQLSALRQHDDAKTLRDNERAMREVEEVVRRHQRNVSVPARVSAVAAIRRVRAESACAAALRAYFDGDRSAAWSGLRRALATYTPIVFSSSSMKVLLRLLLPGRMRSLIFARP